MFNITKIIISKFIPDADIVDIVKNSNGETTLVLRILKIIINNIQLE